MQENTTVPVEYPDELLDAIYNYKPDDHWGVRKEKVNVIKGKSLPVMSFDYSVEKYSLACGLINESFALIDTLMVRTRPDDFLDEINLHKIKSSPPADMLPYINTYLLLG